MENVQHAHFGVPEKLQVGFYLKQHSTFLLHRDSKKKDEDTLRFLIL